MCTIINGVGLGWKDYTAVRWCSNFYLDQIVAGEYQHRVEFEPAPSSNSEPDTKPTEQDATKMPYERAKRTITDYLRNPKRVKTSDDSGWEKSFNEDLLVYQKNLKGSEKVRYTFSKSYKKKKNSGYSIWPSVFFYVPKNTFFPHISKSSDFYISCFPACKPPPDCRLWHGWHLDHHPVRKGVSYGLQWLENFVPWNSRQTQEAPWIWL